MKKFFLTLSSLSFLTLNTYAGGTITCTSEEGSSLTAIVNGDSGSVPTEFKMKIREGKEVELTRASVAYYETGRKFINGSAGDEFIKLLVVKNSLQEIVAIVKDGEILIDKSGVYSAECEFGY